MNLETGKSNFISQNREDLRKILNRDAELGEAKKSLKSLSQKYQDLKADEFVRCLRKGLNGGYISDQDLMSNLESGHKIYFLFRAIETAKRSNSIYSPSISGEFAARVLMNDQRLSSREMIILDVLEVVNEIDIKMFVLISDNMKNYRNDIRTFSFYKAFAYMADIAMRKFKFYGVFDSVDNADKSIFESSEIGEELFRIIKDLKIDIELRKDFY